jgi:hypothetical protein
LFRGLIPICRVFRHFGRSVQRTHFSQAIDFDIPNLLTVVWVFQVIVTGHFK